MGYDERTVRPGAEVWRATGSSGRRRILPDGCLDLVFDGKRLLVAGPDTTARLIDDAGGRATGVRLHAGLGPALLGVPADELRDRQLPLDDVWGDQEARRLTERVAADPVRALAAWARAGADDEFGRRVRVLLTRGFGVARIGEVLGYSARQLHRRCLPVFGYGPQHLGRVLRLLRAVERADGGLGWADVAQRAGYSDQAHLARDVRALTGTTPTGLREERRAT